MVKPMQKILLVLLCVAVFEGCMAPPAIQSAEKRELGTVHGTVYFTGVPCPPGRVKVPPCDGPYPNHEVVAFRSGSREVAGKTVTDKNGRYRLRLPEGTYELRSSDAVSPKGAADASGVVKIKGGSTTRFDLHVDTGVR